MVAAAPVAVSTVASGRVDAQPAGSADFPVPQQVPGASTDVGPAWTQFGSDLTKTLIVWKGAGTDTGIYWSTTSALNPDPRTNQYSWSAPQRVPDAETSVTPAVVHFKGEIYLAWRGAGEDATIYLSTLDSNGVWAPKRALLALGGTSDPPALAATGDKLYLAWKARYPGEDIFFSTTDGTTWSPKAAVPDAATMNAPTLASDGYGAVYIAWKGATDKRIWWSQCSDGEHWSQQQKGPGPIPSPLEGPCLIVDQNARKWLAWSALGLWTMTPTGQLPAGMVFVSQLIDEAANSWSAATGHAVLGSYQRPVLLATGGTEPMLACTSRLSAYNLSMGIRYSPLTFPPLTLDFGIPDIIVMNMRSGSDGIKDESDTVYLSMALKIKGKPPASAIGYLGNLTGGEYGNAHVALPQIQVGDTDTVYFAYLAMNYGGSAADAGTYVSKGVSTLVEALEKADEAAIQQFTGIDLSALSPQEAGALMGAQLGNYVGFVIPGLGAYLGAIAGWFADNLYSFTFPNCNGPVAAAFYAFRGAMLRRTLTAFQTPPGHGLYIQTDDHQGVTSASGCGKNSHYQVIWNVQGG